jgi:hypothetical protein
MLLKAADDRLKRLTLLEDLQRSTLLDTGQREWLRSELHATRRGIAGERDAAHYLDSYLKSDRDRAVLHDLRFEVDGEVVQIDHLVITRGLFVYLLETKNFNGSLHINAFGEFSVEYSGERVFGIPSPLEQSRRHEGPLRRLFEKLGIVGRNGGAPQFHHCVLVHPSSVIHRPPDNEFDTRNVIKADQFRSWHERFQEQNTGLGQVVGSILNMRGAETIKEFGEKLVRRHRPTDPLYLPDFMQPRKPAVRSPVEVARNPKVAGAQRDPLSAASPAAPRKLVCATCGAKITFPEGKFCWNNEGRFGGLQYCRTHQAAYAVRGASAPAQAA